MPLLTYRFLAGKYLGSNLQRTADPNQYFYYCGKLIQYTYVSACPHIRTYFWMCMYVETDKQLHQDLLALTIAHILFVAGNFFLLFHSISHIDRGGQG